VTIERVIPRMPALSARPLARRVLRATTVIVSTAVALFGAVALTPTAPRASADGCPDIEVVFARGTDEPASIGRVGQSFVDSLRKQVGGRSVGVYAVNYPATYNFLAAANGANDASAHIQYMMANCPNTRLVLGGYSQGAAIVDVLTSVPFPAVGFNAPLPPDAPDHIAAVAVFGNPTAKVGIPLTASPTYGFKAIDLCNAGDPVCSDGNSVPAHSNYGPTGLTSQAAAFVAGLV
jgi:cutinase